MLIPSGRRTPAGRETNYELQELGADGVSAMPKSHVRVVVKTVTVIVLQTVEDDVQRLSQSPRVINHLMFTLFEFRHAVT